MRHLIFIGLALTLTACTKNSVDKENVDDEKTLQRMSRLMDAIDPPSSLPTPAPADGDSVAPVGNLLTGLEERLANEPDDAAGWVLLAQSYAFVGRNDDAARAIEQAVALGMNEAELSERVDRARSPHPSVANNP